MSDMEARLDVGRIRLAVVIYEYAGNTHPPLLAANRYGRLVGCGLRLPRRRLLSVQWRRP